MAFLKALETGIQQTTKVLQRTSNVIGSVQQLAQAFENATNPVSYTTNNRLGNLPAGAQPTNSNNPSSTNVFSDTDLGGDWRVRIHLPNLSEYNGEGLLSPLTTTGDSMVFPTTPQILIQHSANYTPMSPTHTNYAFPIYSNSAVEDITITCEWPVENEGDGLYWIASTHFLRSVTKMYYGKSQNQGLPPPICKLSGYGTYVFNQVPVVVKMFSVDMPQDVDYIKVPFAAGGYTYVPTLGRLSVVVGPAYSRNEVRQFNLQDFVKQGQGGFI